MGGDQVKLFVHRSNGALAVTQLQPKQHLRRRQSPKPHPVVQLGHYQFNSYPRPPYLRKRPFSYINL